MKRKPSTRLHLVLFFCLSLLTSVGVQAQQGGGAASASVVKGVSGRFEAFMTAGYVGIGSSATQMDLAPGLQFVPFSGFTWLQLGGEVAYEKISFRGGSASSLLVLGGPTINIGPSGINDAVFLSIGVAYRSGSADGSSEDAINPGGVGFYFIAGKRIPFLGSFSLRPSLGMVSCGTTAMVFRPFAMSYHF